MAIQNFFQKVSLKVETVLLEVCWFLNFYAKVWNTIIISNVCGVRLPVSKNGNINKNIMNVFNNQVYYLNHILPTSFNVLPMKKPFPTCVLTGGHACFTCIPVRIIYISLNFIINKGLILLF